MKLIVTTSEELAELVNESVNHSISEYFTNKEKQLSKEQHITIKAAAKLLKVDTQTVRNYIKRGTITAKKVGRRILIDTASIDKALSEVKSLKYKR
jgi:excisionase family DNA binding protein